MLSVKTRVILPAPRAVPKKPSDSHTCHSTHHRRSLLQSSLLIGGSSACTGVGGDPSLALPLDPRLNSDGPLISRQLERRVSEFTLANGMHFIVVRREAFPVVSFHTYADVGAFDEPDGKTGMAHFLEHLAFKGTPNVGSKNFKKEEALLEAMDDVFYSMLDSRSGREQAAMERQLDRLASQAADLSIPNAYGSLLRREGAVGLNAVTTHDSTRYFCSLPSNKIELWFAMESQRFQVPIFRDFYTEKKVILEERRLRVDNAPLGPFQERFASLSLQNNYKRPVIGYEHDLKRLGRREVAEFFKSFYGPDSITVAIVGDVDPEDVQRLAEKYFGPWSKEVLSRPACESPSFETHVYDEQQRLSKERSFEDRSKAGPALLRAYDRPCLGQDPTMSVALDAINDLLTGSRTSRLYSNLVSRGAALSISSFATFPAEKHPCQLVIYGIPAPGVALEELDEMIGRELAVLASQGPTKSELKRYSKAARMGALDVVTSNASLAAALASYHYLMGSWREVYRDLERVDALTPQDIARVASIVLTPDNSFAGYLRSAK
jgi:predicted Zn-dependent peptidase